MAEILRQAATPEELGLRRKAAFLVKNLVIEDETTLPKFKEEGIMDIFEAIVYSSEDQELVEKLLQLAIVILRRNPEVILPERKARLLRELSNIRKRVTGEENGQFTLEQEDLEDLESLLKGDQPDQ